MPTEYKLLEFMVRNSGQVLTRTMIFEAIWGYHFEPRTNIVETHVSRLRGKIAVGEGLELIHTVRGSGYRMQGPD